MTGRRETNVTFAVRAEDENKLLLFIESMILDLNESFRL